MAQNITLLGASYSAVPAVQLPKTGGGTATYTDVTDTTAAAADVAQGKYFYTAAGVKTEGTGSGGGGGVTVTDEPNATGITCVITSGGSPTPPTPDIPLNTQLVDYTKTTADRAIDSNGDVITQQWYYVSDYTAVAQGMTFTYTAGIWTYIGLYNSSKTALGTIYVYSDGTVDPGDSNIAHGTLSGNKLPIGVAYVRIASTGDNSSRMSLIRTA